jgi:hypothetical protein
MDVTLNIWNFFQTIVIMLIIGIIVGATGFHFIRKYRLYEMIFFLFPSAIYCWIKEKNQNSQFHENSAHHAVIVNATRPWTKFAIYAVGAYILLLNFEKNHNPIPYRLYVCSTPEQLKDVINSEDTTFLWIFGHGEKHAVDFGKRTLFYCDVRNAPRKGFIGQYHCNHGDGVSLVEYNSPNHFDLTNDTRNLENIRKDVGKKLKELGINPLKFTIFIVLNEILLNIEKIVGL